MAGEAHESNGAGEGFRTPDLLITNQLLYQLSYASSRAPPVRAAPRTGHGASPEKAHKLKPPPAGGDQGPILANSGGGVKKLCTPRGGLAAGPNGPFRGPIDKDPPRSMGGPPMLRPTCPRLRWNRTAKRTDCRDRRGTPESRARPPLSTLPNLEHPVDRFARARDDVGRQLDLVLQLFERLERVFHRDLVHVRAAETAQPQHVFVRVR